MDDLLLTPATVSDGHDVLEMLHEIGPGMYGFHNDAHALSPQEFHAWLHVQVSAARGIGLDDDAVPQTTFWLRRGGRPIGLSRLRHSLNARLLNRGGNIGFCVRPGERGQGYAPLLLRRTLEAARDLGLDRVLLTCDTLNTASWKTIEKCGGKLENLQDGWRRYWIEIVES